SEKGAAAAISSDTEVRSGYGIPQCHLGMSIDEVLASLGPYANKQSSKKLGFEYLRYPSLGISVGIKDERVQLISFYFRSKSDGTFVGRLQAGLNASSRVNEFVAAYGQPLKRIESVESEFGASPGQLDVSLFYIDQGLGVEFAGDLLKVAEVYPPA